jgi:3-hydroxybutyryl-CoA dehydrogenase
MSGQKKVAVIGAGLMGTGIAYTFALLDTSVVLVDNSEKALEKAKAQITKMAAGAVERGKLDAEQAKKALAGLELATNITPSCKGASLFIETATENLQIKQDIIREGEACIGADALFATNTSALSITEIASVLQRPERLIGMHFFNPVHKMKLVELVRGIATSDETVKEAQDWIAETGKQTILVNEMPGFTTSRMSALMGNEAMYMLAEGVASAEDIDTSLRMAFNHPMGPLELGDLTGWDTRLSVLEYLHGVYGEKFRPCPLITKMVKAGRYGRKTGHGVYKYDEDGKKVPGSGLKVS